MALVINNVTVNEEVLVPKTSLKDLLLGKGGLCYNDLITFFYSRNTNC